MSENAKNALNITENLTKWPNYTSIHQKMQKECHKWQKKFEKRQKMAKKSKNGRHWGPTFPCYTEAHLENQSGRARCAHNGPPGFLGGLR